MMNTLKKNTLPLLAAIALSSTLSLNAMATVVHIETNMGDFQVNLFDEQTPLTVANFLDYVQTQSYDSAIFHRSINGFITQTGGYSFSIDDQTVYDIPNLGSVNNEAIFSNVRGTLAMAKVGGDPDSATSQWFINLSDNSVNLDNQNGGFTVFGVVMGDGMEIVDSMAQLPTYYLNSLFSDLPLREAPQDGIAINEQQLVLIESVTVIDSNSVTYPELTPPLSSRTDDSDSSSGGGTIGAFTLALLALARLWRKR